MPKGTKVDRSYFTSSLIIEQISGELWKTNKEFSYYNKNFNITVPKGFITDLASVPWPFSMIIPKSGLYNQAAVLHDFLYYVKITTRKDADKYFLDGMKILGVNLFKRHIMYRAVRTFAGQIWNSREGKFNVEI